MASGEWTWQDYDTLYTNWGCLPVKDIAAELKKTEKAVVERAEQLGLVTVAKDRTKEKQLVHQYGKQIGTAIIFLAPYLGTTEVEMLLSEVMSRTYHMPDTSM